MTARTDKQKRAQERNWQILQLRSVYNQTRRTDVFTQEERCMVQCIVDNALKRLGAESETIRNVKARVEFDFDHNLRSHLLP